MSPHCHPPRPGPQHLLNGLPPQVLPFQSAFHMANRAMFLQHNSDPVAALLKTFNASLEPSRQSPNPLAWRAGPSVTGPRPSPPDSSLGSQQPQLQCRRTQCLKAASPHATAIEASSLRSLPSPPCPTKAHTAWHPSQRRLLCPPGPGFDSLKI